MKTSLFLTSILSVGLLSCGCSKKTVAPAIESKTEKTTNLEGRQVVTETLVLSGIEMSQVLNEDGTSMINRPYKWYAGIGKADDKGTAIEIAQREAYATISRLLNNAVYDEAERGKVVNTGRVQQALTSHWNQISTSLQKGCEPFGSNKIEYDPATRMYEATCKIGIRGDLFNQMMNTAGNFKPSDLKGDELEQFIEVNKAIMEAARGK